MKQKIVIKVQMNCDKCRSNALKIAAKASGVISVALEGEDKDKVVVIGDGVDAACLTASLRKKNGYASLESVDEVKEKQEKKSEGKEKVEKKDGDESKKATPTPWIPNYGQPPHFQMYEVVYEPNPPRCTIL